MERLSPLSIQTIIKTESKILLIAKRNSLLHGIKARVPIKAESNCDFKRTV